MSLYKLFPFIFINDCIFCGKEYEGTICENCRKKIFIKGASQTQFKNKLYYLTIYNKYGEILIEYLKNKKYFSLINFLLKKGEEILNNEYDYITTIPSLKFISYIPEHLEIFSKELAKRKNSKYVEFFGKNKRVKSQTVISLKERFTNPIDAFVLRRDYKNLIPQSKILIIDDVYTTGSTLRECEKLIMNMGGNVEALVFSKAILNI
ncbi:MAG: ComF family protein [Caldisericia bacterium]|nr:ComF family protein [Caldisericia bacterium]